MPFFSIIIPTFNSRNTVPSCLSSILQQTMRNFEIILQDGGSCDGTRDIVLDMNDTRIHFYAEPDTGIYDAMNKAVERTSGEWILFLGSDDYLYGNTVLSDIHAELIQYNNTVDMVYGNVKIIGDTPWAKDGTIYRGEIDTPTLLNKHNYCHQAIFYHRRIFDDGHRYNPKYRICADYDFNLLCTAKYQVKYVPTVVSSFVSGGLSSIDEDELFAQDTWINIIRYFGSKLRNRSFFPFRKDMKKAAKVFFNRFDLYNAVVAFSLYLYHSSRKHRFIGKAGF